MSSISRSTTASAEIHVNHKSTQHERGAWENVLSHTPRFCSVCTSPDFRLKSGLCRQNQHPLPPHLFGSQTQLIKHRIGNDAGISGIVRQQAILPCPTRSISRRTPCASSRLIPTEKRPSNGVLFSLATCVTIIFMAPGVAIPLRANAASARTLTSSGTLI